MKLLAVFFLVGFALCAAVPVPETQEVCLDDVEELDVLLSSFLEGEDDDEIKTELGRKLKEHLDGILEKIRDAIENGKTVKEETLEKLREIREKLKELKVEFSKKAKELLERILEKGKDYWKKILDRITGNEKTERRFFDEIIKRLKETAEKMLEGLKDTLEKGNEISDKAIEQMMDMMKRMKTFGIDFTKQLLDFVEKLHGEVKEKFEKILEKLGIRKSTIEYSDDGEKRFFDEIIKRLKETAEKMLEGLKDTLEKGNEISDKAIEQMMNMMKRMKTFGIDVTQLVLDFVENLHGEVKEKFEKILEKLGIRKSTIEYSDDGVDDEIKTELGKKLKEHLDGILETIREAIEDGKIVKEETLEKLRAIREKLRELKVELGRKAKELLERIKEKGKDYWKKILEKITGKERMKRNIFEEIRKTLEEAFKRLMDGFKDALEKGNEISGRTIEQMKDVIKKMKGLGMDISQKVLEYVANLHGEIKEKLEELLEKLGIGKSTIEFSDDGADERTLKERFEEFVKHIKDALENGKSFRDGFEKLKELRQKLKDLKVELGEKGKEMIKKLRHKLLEYRDKVLEKLKGKRFLNVKDLLKKLKEKVLDALDADDVKAKIEELFGKGSDFAQKLREKLKEKGGQWKQSILDMIDRMLKDKEEKRSIKDVYEKLKETFRDLKIDLKEKFTKFAEWVKDKFDKGLEKGKDKVENLRNIAREFINDTKVMGKDVAEQAKEFFREYKEDLGDIYNDVLDKVKKILKGD